MRTILNCVSLLSIATVLSSCSSETDKTWTVTGHLIQTHPDTVEPQSVEATNLPSDTAPGDSTNVDLSTASISINQQVRNETGEMISIELASGKFEDESVTLRGNIDKLTEVEITVELESENVLTTTAIIGPDSKVSFALIDYLDSKLDRLVLYGVSNRAIDSERKFVISGDLKDIVDVDQLAIVDLSSEMWNDKGEYDTKDFGSVLLRDGSFHFEADIDDPTAVDISVELIGDRFTHIYGVAVVEPKSTIEVTTRGSSTDLMTCSDSELHSMLVESWQRNEEYQVKMDRAQLLQQEWLATWQSQQTETVDSGTNGESEESLTESSEDDVSLSEPDESTTSAVPVGVPVAEGCEHVDLTDIRLSIAESFEVPEFRVLEDEAWQIRVDTLEEIALNTEEPWVVLLTVELGAFEYFFGDLKHAPTIYDDLESQLEEDVYTRRLRARREMLNSYIASERIAEIDKRLVPGQKAPLFTLPDLKNDEIELLDVLESRDLVYIDFWASWCGPCIATFPKLRKLYASYKEHGFEIMLVSIDDTFEDWEEASREQDLPWLNVADIGGFEEETPVAYGVRSIPKAYLVDAKGCIIQKDLAPEVLEEVLAKRYGESAQPVE